jgi:hypothetical protein
MNFTAALHLREDDDIEVKPVKSASRGQVGVVTIDLIPIFPANRQQCRDIAAAFMEASQHFDHVRPMGVRDIDARDAHDEEGIGNG